MIVNFEEYNKKEKELEEYKKSLCKLIDDYILYNKLIDNEAYKGCFDYFFDQHGKFTIHYKEMFYYSQQFVIDSYMDLKKFVEDPELYKNTKKYNL